MYRVSIESIKDESNYELDNFDRIQRSSKLFNKIKDICEEDEFSVLEDQGEEELPVEIKDI